MKHKNDLFFITKLNGKEKFSFRKISVGLVTVALGRSEEHTSELQSP